MAEREAVIGGVDDDRVLLPPLRAQRIEDAAHVPIDVRHRGAVVCVAAHALLARERRALREALVFVPRMRA